MRASKLIALAFAGLVFTVCAAHANETSDAAPADAARTTDVTFSTDADDKMVCEYEKRVGTHMKTRVCKTVAQRRQEREKAQELLHGKVLCGAGCNR